VEVLDLGLGDLIYAYAYPKVNLMFRGRIPPRQRPLGPGKRGGPRRDVDRELSESRRKNRVLRRVEARSRPPSAPAVLEFRLGGMRARQPSGFEWDDDSGVLRCSFAGRCVPPRAPTEEEWRRFWMMCEGFRVWSWSMDDDLSQIKDGRTLSMVFQIEDRYVQVTSMRGGGGVLGRKIQLIHRDSISGHDAIGAETASRGISPAILRFR